MVPLTDAWVWNCRSGGVGMLGEHQTRPARGAKEKRACLDWPLALGVKVGQTRIRDWQLLMRRAQTRFHSEADRAVPGINSHAHVGSAINHHLDLAKGFGPILVRRRASCHTHAYAWPPWGPPVDVHVCSHPQMWVAHSPWRFAQNKEESLW
jgi:hypothetical protein